jgi:hypothetical protein
MERADARETCSGKGTANPCRWIKSKNVSKDKVTSSHGEECCEGYLELAGLSAFEFCLLEWAVEFSLSLPVDL